MYYDPLGQCYVIRRPEDLEGWTVMAVEAWKPGTVRLHLRQMPLAPVGGPLGHFRRAFAPEALVPIMVPGSSDLVVCES